MTFSNAGGYIFQNLIYISTYVYNWPIPAKIIYINLISLYVLVYFSWPDPDAPPTWQLLGYISNDKPSCVFKISNLKRNHELMAPKNGMLSFDQSKISHVAQIGISVESIDLVQQQIALIDKTASNQSLFVEFSQKMVQNLFNYASSFAITQAEMTPTPNETYIPLSALQNWYLNFERRLSINPYFWQS